jgi:hypothetical protein
MMGGVSGVSLIKLPSSSASLMIRGRSNNRPVALLGETQPAISLVTMIHFLTNNTPHRQPAEDHELVLETLPGDG